IIPARGGSKGITNKNIMDFCGKPLLAWSILQANQAKTVNAVYVTSDDETIMRVAEDFGAIPIKRPDELSTDTATSEAALLHALDHIEKQRTKKIDLVVFLQATSPLRESEDIDGAIQKLIDENADSLFSSARLEDFFIWQETEEGLKSLNFDYTRRLRRQDVKPQYVENGSIYLFKPHVLRTTNNRIGGCIATYEMDFWKTWEIDSLEDKTLCEWYFINRLMNRFVNLPFEAIELIVYDFDGVMTDNRVLTLQDGTEAVFANRSDGLAVNMIKKMGIKQVIISMETNPVVKARAEKIGIHCLQGIGDKLDILKKYLTENNIDKDKVAFIGNEINDIPAMSYVGFPVAPADAYPEIKNISKIVLKTNGGYGVVREFFDLIKRSIKR
ncbi:MAG: acylneuraminate cytidylyltransferase, partial [Candidatus Methanoperedens sp.]